MLSTDLHAQVSSLENEQNIFFFFLLKFRGGITFFGSLWVKKYANNLRGRKCLRGERRAPFLHCSSNILQVQVSQDALYEWRSKFQRTQQTTTQAHAPIEYGQNTPNHLLLYRTGLLILNHSYLVGNLTNSKIAERKALLEPLQS
jgi:hypothetical protein